MNMAEFRLELVKQSSNLRKLMISELKKLNSWSVGLGESLFRNKISQHEKILDSLEEKVFNYNENVGRYVGSATTLRGEGINLNVRMSFGISCSQLSDERNAVMSLLNNIQQNLNDKKNRANSLITLSISMIAIVISTLALIFR